MTTPKVYEALQNADTVGMFQVESRAQIAFLPKSKPRTFYDIVVQVAIIRPGPVVGNMLSSYISRRQGKEKVDYIHPRLKPTLERTMGVPLFQEQLLKIAMEIADFSGGEAEELRRAMGFKRPDRRMEKIEANLRAGMNRNGINTEAQDTIVKCVKAFANYGFPESHAFSFALLAYASAYFMVHYRAAFMTAMFNNYPLGFYSAATLVKDAQRHGLHFLPLDINRSQYLFTVEEVDAEKQVRLGLKYVRGLRKEVGEAIVAERDHPVRLRRSIGGEACLTGQASHTSAAMPPSFGLNGGIAADLFQPVPEKHSFSANRAAEPQASCACQPLPYTSIEDLVRRVPLINKREIRALSMAGALNFDNTVHRREALWQSELAIQPPGDLFDSVSSPHVSKGSVDDETPFLKRLDGLDLIEADLKKTGISIGKHPMTFVREEMTRRGILSAAQTRHTRKGSIVSAAGAVIIRQRPMTAKNVVFITLEDETGHSNFVVMPDIFEKFRDTITQNNYLIIKGRAEDGGVIKALYFEPVYRIKAEVVSHNFR